MSDFAASVGSICKLVLLDHFGSIVKAARELGVPYGTLRRKLRGGRLTVIDIVHIANVVEISAGELLAAAEEFQRGNAA